MLTHLSFIQVFGDILLKARPINYLIGFEPNVKGLSDKCKDLKGNEPDIYRYQEAREDFIAKFFGDFLTYLNTNTGSSIREEILIQFQKFIKNHPEDKEVAIVSHSLGTLVLWDLLFAKDLPENDPAYEFRKF
ncbi:MAG TPA: hypothetical protein DCZ88_05250, partial [Pseudanabaena sp.]|nr:hypothetical protein [Pseudanabaena sp.]